MDAYQILLANCRIHSLPFPERRRHAHQHARQQPAVRCESCTLSRFEATADGRWKFDIMSRVTEGQPTDGRFLIEQRSGGSPWPLTWLGTSDARKSPPVCLQPWQPFPGSALRWMDYIIPPAGDVHCLIERRRPLPLLSTGTRLLRVGSST